MMVIYCKDQKTIFIDEVDNFLKYAERPGKPMYTRKFTKELKMISTHERYINWINTDDEYLYEI
jgi:hypothetical protein